MSNTQQSDYPLSVLKNYIARIQAYGEIREVYIRAHNKKEVREIVKWQHYAEKIFEIGLNPHRPV